MSSEKPIDVRDMAIVHAGFRSGFTESAALVRRDPTPGPERTAFLADHIDFAVLLLHHHHEGEDELLYPLILERAPHEAEMTARIEHEHLEVAGRIEAVAEASRAWRTGPTPATAEALASALEDLNAALQPHLDHEENKVVPLAATLLTQEEWNTLGEHAVAAIPKQRLPIAFGMILEPLAPEDAAYMKQHLPTPVRLLYPLLIERPWKKYAAQLRG